MLFEWNKFRGHRPRRPPARRPDHCHMGRPPNHFVWELTDLACLRVMLFLMYPISSLQAAFWENKKNAHKINSHIILSISYDKKFGE